MLLAVLIGILQQEPRHTHRSMGGTERPEDTRMERKRNGDGIEERTWRRDGIRAGNHFASDSRYSHRHRWNDLRFTSVRRLSIWFDAVATSSVPKKHRECGNVSDDNLREPLEIATGTSGRVMKLGSEERAPRGVGSESVCGGIVCGAPETGALAYLETLSLWPC